MNKSNLDKRICDVYGGENEQTLREFVEETEIEFDLPPMFLNDMSRYKLSLYIDFLDELWVK